MIHKFEIESIVVGVYRPFNKQHLYFSRDFNEAIGLSPKFFPSKDSKNLLICVSPSQNDGLSVLITDTIANLHYNGDTQAFPLYYYEYRPENELELFESNSNDNYLRNEGISNYILNFARKKYGNSISTDSVFYYVYGMLHNHDYRDKFSSDLKKSLPRIPLVDDVKDFWSFSKAGRALADLHINYEKVPAYKGVKVEGLRSGDYAVEKMRFPQKGQKDTILYNNSITIRDIPARAYEYVVNGKSAIEWVMERYQVTVHKDSGIVNDPNDWAKESGNPRYILDLLLSVINVSMQTVEIVEGLPRLKFGDL